MIEIKNQFIIKHREDVIDTLQLRQKERRVLLTLIAILFLTVVYENSSWLFSGMLGDAYVAPALGQRQKKGIESSNFMRLDQALDEIIVEYPQFRTHLLRQQQNLRQIMAEAGSDKAFLATIVELLNNLYEFVSLPVISPGKKLEVLAKELQHLSKLLNIQLKQDFAIKPIEFKTVEPIKKTVGTRNLFEYDNR